MSERYLDTTLTAEERAEDLLSKMTLEEKGRQLGCVMVVNPEIRPDEFDLEGGIGEVSVMPCMQSVKELKEYISVLQKRTIGQSRLGIPALFHCEALSGPVIPQGQQFPTSISLAATFEPEIVRDMSERSRRQLKAVGIRQALSPVLDVARDLRWGRIGETYGGDPTLVSEMACAFVDGLQGEDLSDGIAATAKHFLGYSSTEGGLNMGRTVASGREIREVFAKPFEAAIRKSNICSVMNSYSEIDGKPVCANREILNDLLRGDLGFNGMVISDAMSIPRLVNVFHTSEDIQDAGIQCLKAGLDLEIPMRYGYGDCLVEAVKEGKVSESYVDRAAKRVLTLKFSLGLFENPYPADDLCGTFDNTQNDEAALNAARKSMTLTKNDGILPLARGTKIAVIGPHGNSLRLLYSGYTYIPYLEMSSTYRNAMAGIETVSEHVSIAAMPVRNIDMKPFDNLIRSWYPNAETIYEALLKYFPDAVYERGCSYNDENDTDFESAVNAAKDADAVILTVGEKNGWGLFCTEGEGIDTVDIGLPGAQNELISKIYGVNKNIIIVHIAAKPLVNEWAYDSARAVLQAWLPCQTGGRAIAETLIGINNPAGRLPYDVPRSIGQCPVYHYKHNGSGFNTFAAGAVNPEGYIDCTAQPLLPFGYGLSYTDYEYADATVSKEGLDIQISVSVKNIGGKDGEEVVQLYGRDRIASIIRPEQELLGFKRIALKKGQSAKVIFNASLSQLAFENDDKVLTVERGDFDFYVGSCAYDERLKATVRQNETVKIERSVRRFFAEAEIIYN